MQYKVDFQLAPFGVITARRVVAGDGARAWRVLDRVGAIAQHGKHGASLPRGGEEQFHVIVVRRRDKAVQVVAGQGDAAHVRRQLLGAHDGEHAQFQVMPHALDSVRTWCGR